MSFTVSDWALRRTKMIGALTHIRGGIQHFDVGRNLIEEPISQDCIQCHKPITPGDFFPIFIGPARIGNRHLVNSPFALSDFYGDFRLESETVRLQAHAFNYLAPEHLIASFHVGKIQVRDDVREQREKLVADVVPEKMYTLRSTQEPRAIHHVRAAVE